MRHVAPQVTAVLSWWVEAIDDTCAVDIRGGLTWSNHPFPKSGTTLQLFPRVVLFDTIQEFGRMQRL